VELAAVERGFLGFLATLQRVWGVRTLSSLPSQLLARGLRRLGRLISPHGRARGNHRLTSPQSRP
jgi:hypothetical protein